MRSSNRGSPSGVLAVRGGAVMPESRAAWWAEIREYLNDSVVWFSEEGRPRRERAAVREFLKYLGVDFEDSELTIPAQDGDIDVRFRGARFQNVERMNPDRRRHDEIRRMAARARAADDISALEITRSASVPMGMAELVREVVKALEKKTRKTTNRASLDALVYMNLRGRHLYPPADVIEDDTTAVVQLGWRSVSVLWPPYAVVICAQSTAPTFMRAKTRKVIRYRGLPWEDTAEPSGTNPLAGLTSAVAGGLTALAYVALGGLVLTARFLRQAIGTSMDPAAL
jgi:putative endonuclease (uncharacterized protein DUF1780)